MTKKQQMQSFMLPFTVTIIFPSLLLLFLGSSDPWFTWPPYIGVLSLTDIARLLIGGTLILLGLALLSLTVRKFAKEGEGTLSPLHPPRHLVVSGIYRHVRNPMIIGVLGIVLGESFLLPSLWILILWIIFFVGNHVYFIKSEEPGLIARFGTEYVEYMENVPRWIPRRSPWVPSTEVKEPPSSVP